MKTHVNLYSAELFGGERFPIQKVAVQGAFCALLLAILVGTGWEWFRARALTAEVQEIRNRQNFALQSLVALQAENEVIFLQQRQAADSAKARERLLAELAQTRIVWSSLVREISFLVPGDLWLTDLEGITQEGKPAAKGGEATIRGVRLKGFAMSYPDITRFMSEMERSRYFRDVVLLVAEKSHESGRTRIEFQMNASLRRS